MTGTNGNGHHPDGSSAWDPTQHEATELADATAGTNGTRPVDNQPDNHDTDIDGGALGRKSVSTVLVEIAHEQYRFGVSDDGDTFAIPKTGPRVVSMLRGGKRSLRAQLARSYFARTGRTASQQALADALLVIEGTAQETDEQSLHLRVARGDEALWLDLGDHNGTAIKITPGGWSIEAQVPVLFRRTALTAPLPTPVAGGDLGELWQWLNVEDDDRALLAAWLVAALRPDTPHPVLGLFGEQGTGKTSAMKLVVSAVDASPVPARKPPRDPDSWVTAAAGSWVVGLDNLSDIPPWLSDSICRAVTGDGDVRRRLYTDADLAVFSFRRCIIFNGIDLGGLRGDLADRLVPIHLRRIPDTDRLDEERLWPAWAQAHPRILGALLDLASAVARTLPGIDLAAKPRMADFARIVAAVDDTLGTQAYGHYLAKQGALATDTLTGDDFIAALRRRIESTFCGTSADLLTLATPEDPEWRPPNPKRWPSNARAVTTHLHRQAPVMRKAGWAIDDDAGNNRAGTLQWTITPPQDRGDGNPDPRSPRNPRQVAEQDFLPLQGPGQTAGTAGHAGNPDPRLTRIPAPNPRPTAPETPGQGTTAGHAGHAGHESVPPLLGGPTDGDIWSLEYPCASCGGPTAHVTGFCPGCLALQAPEEGNQ